MKTGELASFISPGLGASAEAPRGRPPSLGIKRAYPRYSFSPLGATQVFWALEGGADV